MHKVFHNFQSFGKKYKYIGQYELLFGEPSDSHLKRKRKYLISHAHPMKRTKVFNIFHSFGKKYKHIAQYELWVGEPSDSHLIRKTKPRFPGVLINAQNLSIVTSSVLPKHASLANSKILSCSSSEKVRTLLKFLLNL